MNVLFTDTFGTGETVVLVHGWAMNSMVWRDFALALAKTYKVICVDLPGHGHSRSIADFNLDTIAQLLADKVKDKPCIWLGWSLGAEIVLHFAHRYPEKVRKLILLAGTPCFVHKPGWPGVNKTVLEQFSATLSDSVNRTVLRFLTLQSQGLPEAKILLRQLQAAVIGNGLPDQGSLQAGLKILVEADLRPELSRITMPILVILGEKDILIPYVIAEKLTKLNPNLATYSVDTAGHMPFLSHQNDIVKRINQFIEIH
jgi:pimeloyl-[acyl-carrier protein] methyl ester esterase